MLRSRAFVEKNVEKKVKNLHGIKKYPIFVRFLHVM